jgi:hypothetical protein
MGVKEIMSFQFSRECTGIFPPICICPPGPTGLLDLQVLREQLGQLALPERLELLDQPVRSAMSRRTFSPAWWFNRGLILFVEIRHEKSSPSSQVTREKRASSAGKITAFLRL